MLVLRSCFTCCLWCDEVKVEHYTNSTQPVFSAFGLMCVTFPFSAGHQHSTFDWVHQRPQNQPQSGHHQRGGSLQGTWRAAIAVHVARGMFLHPVLTALTLLSAHGAHHRRHRGPLWAVEPLLLERQVRAFSLLLFARSARQQLRIFLICSLWWPAKCTHISLRLLLLTAQLVPVIKSKAKDSAVKPKRGGSFSLPALSCSLCSFFVWQCYCSLLDCVGILTAN